MNAISHTPLSPQCSSAKRMHQIPVYATGCTITYQGFKLWSSANHLLTHVILFRAACGSNIRTAAPPTHVCIPPQFYHFIKCNVVFGFFQIIITFSSYISNACHSFSGVAERLLHIYVLRLFVGNNCTPRIPSTVRTLPMHATHVVSSEGLERPSISSGFIALSHSRPFMLHQRMPCSSE